MIRANNIAELFDFIKKNRKLNNLTLNISKKGIVQTNEKGKADIVIKNNSIVFNVKIDPILRQSCEIILPLIRKKDRNFIGQIGQSLDAKIALNNGNSHYINEKESITYLHCLRSISDGVLVGVNTIIKDNPLLTTRKIKGQNPTRLIIDPSLKLTNKYKIFKDKNTNIVFTTSNKTKNLNNTTIVKLPKKDFTLGVFKLSSLSRRYLISSSYPSNLDVTNSISLASAKPSTTSSNPSIRPVNEYQPAIPVDRTVTRAMIFWIDNPNFLFFISSIADSASTTFFFAILQLQVYC